MKFISSTFAFLIYVFVMVGGYVWATFFVTAPYVTLAGFLTTGVGAYFGKRLMQKRVAFGGSENGETTGEEK